MSLADEQERIRREYARRDSAGRSDHYLATAPAQVFMRQSRERMVVEMLRRSKRLPLSSARVLDIGCGYGQWLADFESWGAERDNLAGIDLVEERAVRARERLGSRGAGGADIRVGDASSLPWADASFDLVVQSMVFSSILDSRMRDAVAREMTRVLSKDGLVLFLDFVRSNPRNRHLRPVPAREVSDLFPTLRVIGVRRTGLAPPVARTLASRSHLAAHVTERLGLLNVQSLTVLGR